MHTENELIDWLWELTISPDKCEEAFDSQEEDAEPIGLCFKASSRSHLVAFNLSLISGVIGRKLDNITIDEDSKKITVFFDKVWSKEELRILGEVIDLDLDDPVTTGILPLFVDEEVCLSVRKQYKRSETENDIVISKFFALSDDEKTINSEDETTKGFVLSYGDSHKEIITTESDVHNYRKPYMVLKSKQGQEFDSQLLAYELSIATNEDKLSILKAYQKTVVAPIQQAVERKKFDKKKKKAKRKIQKTSRKKSRS